MTNADRETLRRLSEAATPGPWVVFDDTRPGIDSADPTGRNIIYAARFANGGFGGVGRREDAAFIAAAVNFVRDWLAVSEEPLSIAGEQERLREALLEIGRLPSYNTPSAGECIPRAETLRILRAALAATPAPAEGREAVREAEGIDVERLAGAICNAEAVRYEETYRYADFDEWGREGFREEARRVATEYAALARTGGSTDGE